MTHQHLVKRGAGGAFAPRNFKALVTKPTDVPPEILKITLIFTFFGKSAPPPWNLKPYPDAAHANDF